MNSLVIRADADFGIGSGHVMRCWAIAEAWCSIFPESKITFVSHCDHLRPRLENSPWNAVFLTDNDVFPNENDGVITVREAGKVASRVILVDGYKFNNDYFHFLSSSGLQVAVIDDNADTGAEFSDVDTLINYNVYANNEMYKEKKLNSSCNLLTGLKYALLRSEFAPLRRKPDYIHPISVKRIVVSLGGYDQKGELAVNIVQQIVSLQYECEIVVVGAFPENEVHGDGKTRVVSAGFVSNMAAVLNSADVAIAAPGVTAYELAVIGVPAICVITVQNHAHVGRKLEELGAICLAESVDKVGEVFDGICNSSEKRRELVTKAQKLVDGKGAFRVARAMAMK